MGENNEQDVVHASAQEGDPNFITGLPLKTGSIGLPWPDTTFFPASKLGAGLKYNNKPDFMCSNGFQGAKNTLQKFTTCHIRIKVLTSYERNFQTILILGIFGGVVAIGVYLYLRRLIRQR